MNASTTSQSARASSAAGWRTFALALEASLRAAVGVMSSADAMVANSKPKVSCMTNATRSAGDRRSRTTVSAIPTESDSAITSAGSGSSECSSIAVSAASGIRARSRSRHSLLVTVVSQAGRFSMSVSVAVIRSQACCTTSWASASSPRMRPATRIRRGRSASNSWARSFAFRTMSPPRLWLACPSPLCPGLSVCC